MLVRPFTVPTGIVTQREIRGNDFAEKQRHMIRSADSARVG